MGRGSRLNSIGPNQRGKWIVQLTRPIDGRTADSAYTSNCSLRGVEQRGEDGNVAGLMPSHQFLSDEFVAEVAMYVRQSFGNSAGVVEPKDVAEVRGR